MEGREARVGLQGDGAWASQGPEAQVGAVESCRADGGGCRGGWDRSQVRGWGRLGQQSRDLAGRRLEGRIKSLRQRVQISAFPGARWLD